MQRALKFRRRLVNAWVLLLLLLMVGFAVGIRNAYETRRMTQWVSHTQQVLTEAASVRLTRLELKLLGISGHDVLRAIKNDERTKCIPVVVMTSSDYEHDLLECYRDGVNSFVQKPIELTKFREALQQLGKYWLQVNHAPPDAAYGAV